MELRHFAYFVAVAEELSFTAAARRLHVVQSGVSATIRALERELGAQLFERSSQRVVLTRAGEALLPEAHAALDAVQAARDAVRGEREGLRGALDVGAMTALALLDLPGLLARFRAAHPGVAVRLRQSPRGSSGLAQSVAAGELDAAFLSLPGRPWSGLATLPLASHPMVAVVPAAHPLAGRGGARLAELADDEFVDFPPGYGSRDLADQAFAAAGARRRISVEVTDMASAAAYVRRGLGTAVLPRFAAPRRPGVAVLELADAVPPWTLSLATSSARRPSAPLRAFADLVREQVPAAPAAPGEAEADGGSTGWNTD